MKICFLASANDHHTKNGENGLLGEGMRFMLFPLLKMISLGLPFIL